jgi:hypothetical protein
LYLPSPDDKPGLEVKRRSHPLGAVVSVHRIRLIGPWEFAWRSSTGDGAKIEGVAESGTIKMPCDWQSAFGSRGGKVSFSRRFHRPTNLEPHEQVLIILTGVGGSGTIRLNGDSLLEFRAVDSVGVDVTNKLEAFNLLEVEIEHEPIEGKLGGLHAPVVLEIRQS